MADISSQTSSLQGSGSGQAAATIIKPFSREHTSVSDEAADEHSVTAIVKTPEDTPPARDLITLEDCIQWGYDALKNEQLDDALDHFDEGEKWLSSPLVGYGQVRKKIQLLIGRGQVLSVTKGWAHPDVEATFHQGRDLYRSLPKKEREFDDFSALVGLWTYHLVTAQLGEASVWAEWLWERVEEKPPLLVVGRLALGSTFLRLGELEKARSSHEQGIREYIAYSHRVYDYRPGQNPLVVCLTDAATILWLLGYPDQARSLGDVAVTFAKGLGHWFSLAFAQLFTGAVYLLCRDHKSTEELADQACKSGFPIFTTAGTFVLGWVLAERGEFERGIDQMVQGLNDWRKTTGARIGQTHVLVFLSEAYCRAGKVSEGLERIAEGFEELDRTGERWFEAELHRVRGELLLKRGEPEAEAELDFNKAIEIARRQSAKSLELRAVMSLVRLMQKRGARDEARQRLSEIYSWFTEGFDTEDLRDAKTLLDSLS